MSPQFIPLIYVGLSRSTKAYTQLSPEEKQKRSVFRRGSRIDRSRPHDEQASTGTLDSRAILDPRQTGGKQGGGGSSSSSFEQRNQNPPDQRKNTLGRCIALNKIGKGESRRHVTSSPLFLLPPFFLRQECQEQSQSTNLRQLLSPLSPRYENTSTHVRCKSHSRDARRETKRTHGSPPIETITRKSSDNGERYRQSPLYIPLRGGTTNHQLVAYAFPYHGSKSDHNPRNAIGWHEPRELLASSPSASTRILLPRTHESVSALITIILRPGGQTVRLDAHWSHSTPRQLPRHLTSAIVRPVSFTGK